MVQTLQKWWQVYANDAEKRVFVGKDGASGLIRHPEGFKWRSLSALASESGLSEADTEKILAKYLKMGIVLRNEKGDKFGYWELVDPGLGKLPPAGVPRDKRRNRTDYDPKPATRSHGPEHRRRTPSELILRAAG